MPQEYVGAVMTLANQKRGVQMNMAYHGRQVMLTYEMPLGEIVLDFFDKLKSVSRGYASMDYEFKEYRASDVVKVDILLNGEKVDALSIIVHRTQSQYRGRAVVSKMREIISRQMFDVAIQAAIGVNIIARETIKALRKRHHPQEEAAREAESGQEKNEADRLRRGPARGLPRDSASRRLILKKWHSLLLWSSRPSPATSVPGTLVPSKATSRCFCSAPPWSPGSTGWLSASTSCRGANAPPPRSRLR
jgi:hypothetical protein